MQSQPNPFGYGLSYTTFEYSNIEVDDAQTTDESFNVSFTVRNSGGMAGDEVAQIYLSPTTDSQNIRPIQLQGFARISLKPGESRTVQVKLYTEQLGYYSNDGQRQWNIAPGKYSVKVGASSTDIRLNKTVTLKGRTLRKPLREHYFSEILL